jgi:hypothetical protein
MTPVNDQNATTRRLGPDFVLEQRRKFGKYPSGSGIPNAFEREAPATAPRSPEQNQPR